MRLELLRLGSIAAIGAPVPGYLLHADDGTTVLVDTGYAPGSSGTGYDFVKVEPHELVTAQLAERDLKPSDIDVLICTHLDPDHAGNHDAFANAELVIQRSHLAYARSGALDRLELARPHWDFPGARWREVDGDLELLPGIELIASDGHVPGHQSVLVRLPETGSVLLAGDAIAMTQCLDPERRPILPFDTDAAAVRASTAKLVDRARAEDATVVCGHDQPQWLELTAGGGVFG